MSLITYTPSQQVADVEFYKWCMSNLRTPFILKGGAGSGKTYVTMNSFLPTLKNLKLDFILTATTHQANEMLTANISSLVEYEPPVTIHKLLGLVPWNGRAYKNPDPFKDCGYKLIQEPNWLFRGILLIDEAFRIDDTLLTLIGYLVPNARLVFIGDPYQTPPVGFSKSVVDDITDATVVTLREAPRFINGGKLNQTVKFLREAVENQQTEVLRNLPKNSEGIKQVQRSLVQQKLNSFIQNNQPISDSDFVILCGTKKGEYGYNNYIMQQRKKANFPIFNENESFTVETVITHHYSSCAEASQNLRKMRRFKKQLMLHAWKESPYGLTTMYIDALVVLVTPWAKKSIGSNFKSLCAQARKNGKDIVVLRLNIARTIHLAQGLTCKSVYLDLKTVMRWRMPDMRRRLVYTGVSRASKELLYFY